MRKPLALWQVCWFVFLFAGWAFANDSQYGLFLIDQSDSMNQPEYAPRYLRALEATAKEIENFSQEAASFDRVAFYKIVSFNSETGYAERTAWTSDQEYALDALAYLYDERGLETSTLDPTLCEASRDLEMQTSLRNLARVYLFTDANTPMNPICDLQADVDPKEMNSLDDRDLPFLAMAKTAQWRVFLFQGLPAEQRVPLLKPSADARPSEGLLESKTDNEPQLESDLERLAALSGGITMKIDDSRDFIESSLPCTLFDQNCQANKAATSSLWQYFSIGKNSRNIKNYSSPSSNNWYGGQLNNGAQSSAAVSAVRYQDRTYIFYRGNTYTNLHYAWSSDHGNTWQGNGYVQTGGSNPVTQQTYQAPSAIVINGKIRVYFLYPSNGHGLIRYIDSTGVNSNGSLNWSSANTFTGLETIDYGGTVTALLDPVNNEELLVFPSSSTSTVSIYSRSISNPGYWSLKNTFGSITGSDLEAIHTGNDLCIAFRSPDNGLYFMKESESWVPHRVSSSQYGAVTTFNKPGLAYLSGKLVIIFQAIDYDIYQVSSTNGGSSWVSQGQIPEQTKKGLELFTYTYDLPLTCSISGPYYGDTGVFQTFNASASNGTAPYSYQWQVDGFSAGTGSQLNRIFLLPSSYVITLTVTDANNNTATASRVFTAVDPNGGCGQFVICPTREL